MITVRLNIHITYFHPFATVDPHSDDLVWAQGDILRKNQEKMAEFLLGALEFYQMCKSISKQKFCF